MFSTRYYCINPSSVLKQRQQTDVFAAATTFAKAEGILPAPESSHAIKATIDEALKCKETGEKKTILFGLTGTRYFDLAAYAEYRLGNMSSDSPSDEDLHRGFASLPNAASKRIDIMI